MRGRQHHETLSHVHCICCDVNLIEYYNHKGCACRLKIPIRGRQVYRCNRVSRHIILFTIFKEVVGGQIFIFPTGKECLYSGLLRESESLKLYKAVSC